MNIVRYIPYLTLLVTLLSQGVSASERLVTEEEREPKGTVHHGVGAPIPEDNLKDSPTLHKIQQPNFELLEERFPLHFRGFTRMQPDMEWINTLRNEENIFVVDPRIGAKYRVLFDLLEAREELCPDLERLKNAISDREQHTAVHYSLHLGSLLLATSKETEEEVHFFKLAGFSSPYSLISEDNDKEKTLLGLLNGLHSIDKRGNFYHPIFRDFFDREGSIKKILEKSALNPVPYLFPCESSILGFYYLAWTFYNGIHPVPASFPSKEVQSPHLLHGAVESPWGEFCHDLAHAEIDPASQSVKQFTNHLVTAYQRLLTEHLADLTLQEKKQFSLKAMIPAFANFALTVHELYRRSLLSILEGSIGILNEEGYNDLSPRFKAFSVGAFDHAHERAQSMARHYGSPYFVEVLESGLFKSEKPNNVRSDQYFKTSYVTGESQMTDEEIFNIAKKAPPSSFISDHGYPSSGIPIDENQIMDYAVERTKFFIEATLNMLSNEDKVLRVPTNYSRRLNFGHDRGILRAAGNVLRSEYNYAVGPVPNFDSLTEETFEKEAEAYALHLDKGRAHLQDFFFKTASELSTLLKRPGATASVADEFTIGYNAALLRLAEQLPPFDSEEGEEGILTKMLTFVEEALKEPKAENES